MKRDPVVAVAVHVQRTVRAQSSSTHSRYNPLDNNNKSLGEVSLSLSLLLFFLPVDCWHAAHKSTTTTEFLLHFFFLSLLLLVFIFCCLMDEQDLETGGRVMAPQHAEFAGAQQSEEQTNK